MKYLKNTEKGFNDDWKLALLEISYQLERIADGLHGDLECEEDIVKINIKEMNTGNTKI